MKKLFYPLTVLALVSALTACGPNNNALGPNRGPHTQNTTYQTNRTPVNNAYNQTGTGMANNGMIANTRGTTVSYNRQLADRLSGAADAVPGVLGATAIVYGNDAVIGINTARNLTSDTQRRVLERQVHASARSIAPRHSIRVTSDSRMVTRIRTLNKRFQDNQNNMNPGTNFMNPTTVRNNNYSTYNTNGTGYQPFSGNPTPRNNPNTVTGSLANVGNDFAVLLRDLGRTVTAPFR